MVEDDPGIIGAVRAMADQIRREHQMPGGWHVVLPHWVLRGRAWEQFCEEFEASYARRPELSWAGVIGFEISETVTFEYPGPGGTVYSRPRRYTLKRHRDEQETTE